MALRDMVRRAVFQYENDLSNEKKSELMKRWGKDTIS